MRPWGRTRLVGSGVRLLLLMVGNRWIRMLGSGLVNGWLLRVVLWLLLLFLFCATEDVDK